MVITGPRRSGRSTILNQLIAERMRQNLKPYTFILDQADFWKVENLPDHVPCFAVTCLHPDGLPPAFGGARFLRTLCHAHRIHPDPAGARDVREVESVSNE